MQRAVLAFEHFGIEVLPAPTGFMHGKEITPLQHLLPGASRLMASRVALHEYIGLLYYWFLAA